MQKTAQTENTVLLEKEIDKQFISKPWKYILACISLAIIAGVAIFYTVPVFFSSQSSNIETNAEQSPSINNDSSIQPNILFIMFDDLGKNIFCFFLEICELKKKQTAICFLFVCKKKNGCIQ